MVGPFSRTDGWITVNQLSRLRPAYDRDVSAPAIDAMGKPGAHNGLSGSSGLKNVILDEY